MNGKAPSAIIIDQNRTMKNAIAIVFTERTRHKYCLWHITRKLPEKFAAEFEENWKSLLETSGQCMAQWVI